MKDKLYKSNHKKFYYRIKKISIGIVASITFVAILGVPSYTLLENKIQEISEAMEKAEIEKLNEEQSDYE